MSQVNQTEAINTQQITTDGQQVLYQAPTTTYQVANGSTAYQGGYINAGPSQSVVYQKVPQVVNTVVNTGKEVIKGESRIEYVPFEKKVIEYKDEVKIERIPKTRKITEYREEKRIETVPREVTKTDYYAVEYLRQYIPQYIPEKTIEYVARERKVKKYEYIPVERQIVHYPQQSLEAEVSGGYIQGGQTVYTQGGQTVYVQSGQYQTGGQYVSGNQVGGQNVYTTYQPVQGEVRTLETVYQSVPQVYQQTTYVTGGSGVGQQHTYVAGGSGVRQ